MLAMFVNEHRDDWDDHLPYVKMAYRASVQESTGCTLKLLFFGREIVLPLDLMVGKLPVDGRDPPSCLIEYVEWVRQASELAFKLAHENLLVQFDRNGCTTDDQTLGVTKLETWSGGGIHHMLSRN